jgi:serine/threonine protein kinase
MAVQARLKALLDAEGYDVQRELGQGQFGKVVLAKARTSGSLVAVKVVAESFSSANERSMIGRPTHPNVLQIFKSIHVSVVAAGFSCGCKPSLETSFFSCWDVLTHANLFSLIRCSTGTASFAFAS